jgi:predicted metallo-beta-lactamase superfamily hydrolase
MYGTTIVFKWKMILRKIVIKPLASESLGVRSMCTFVETPDVRLLLDAGVSLCPYRFGLPPHPREFKAIAQCRKDITVAADKSEVVTISHYHFDHHTPSYEDWMCNWTVADETAKQIYQEKHVLLKNYREDINSSQRRRGWLFRKTGGKHARKLETADTRTFDYNKTKIRFSKPVFHGAENTFLGWVLMTTIELESEKFMFAPDVQGPMSNGATSLILHERPDVLLIGGPPLYLLGSKVNVRETNFALANLAKIIRKVKCVILEHHILRDESWREKTGSVFENAEKTGSSVITSAEFLGKENMFLESSRKRLYEEEPPSAEFEDWRRRSARLTRPPKPPIE